MSADQDKILGEYATQVAKEKTIEGLVNELKNIYESNAYFNFNNIPNTYIFIFVFTVLVAVFISRYISVTLSTLFALFMGLVIFYLLYAK